MRCRCSDSDEVQISTCPGCVIASCQSNFIWVFFPEYCFTMTEISGKSWDLSLYELHRTPQVTVLFSTARLLKEFTQSKTVNIYSTQVLIYNFSDTLLNTSVHYTQLGKDCNAFFLPPCSQKYRQPKLIWSEYF